MEKVIVFGEIESGTTEGIVTDSNAVRYQDTTVEQELDSIETRLGELGDTVTVDETNKLLKVAVSENKTYVCPVELLAKPNAPTYSGSTGIVTTENEVTIELDASTQGSTIVYTMTSDGTEPADPRTVQSANVGSSITLTGILSSAQKTFKIAAAARKNGEYSETILTTTINTARKVAKPVISVVSGTNIYSSSRSVQISCGTSGAEIRYTTDGSTPDGTSDVYNGEIQLSSTATIKAFANKDGWSKSAYADPLTVEMNAPKIWYGVSTKNAMATISDVKSLPYSIGKSSVGGSYNIVSSANGYIWFCVPNNMTIKNVKASGFDVPLESATTTVSGYKCYRSSEEQIPINDTFVVS